MPTNYERFQTELERQYIGLFETAEYAYARAHTTPARLAEKMTAGLLTGAANKDGAGIRWTCAALAIPYTYKAIRAFLQEGR